MVFISFPTMLPSMLFCSMHLLIYFTLVFNGSLFLSSKELSLFFSQWKHVAIAFAAISFHNFLHFECFFWRILMFQPNYQFLAASYEVIDHLLSVKTTMIPERVLSMFSSFSILGNRSEYVLQLHT